MIPHSCDIMLRGELDKTAIKTAIQVKSNKVI